MIQAARRRIARGLEAIKPRSLTARIVYILVAGLLAAQALTGTLWHGVRRGQLLEVPTRIVAARLADTVRLLDAAAPQDRPAILRALSTPRFTLTLHDHLPSGSPRSDPLGPTPQIMASIIQKRLGRPAEVRLAEVELLNDKAKPAGTWSLLTAREPSARFHVLVRLDPDGRWLELRAIDDENGYQTRTLQTIVDYALRLYVIRIVIIIAIALLVGRFVVAPLKRLGQAAKALGQDINSPPMATDGPHEVRQAAEAFNLMQERLIAGIAERSQFLAAVSHDLRSPITRLRLRTELLKDPPLREKFRADLADMEGMVDATLNLMRGVEAEELRQDIDIDALLAGLIEDQVEQGHRATLSGASLGPYRGYAQSLKRCLQNLIENAVRYGGRADIVVEDNAATLCIQVRDKGSGLPADELERVFDPFYRLEDSRNMALGGHGLGLSIARTVALAHGGTIVLSNRTEGGLEARLNLGRLQGRSANSGLPKS